MKITWIFLVSLLVTPLIAQELSTQRDTLSYSLGIIVAQNLQHQGISDIDTDLFSQAIHAVMSGKDGVITSQGAQSFLINYQQKKQASEYAAVKAEGEKFLMENANRPEVTTLEGGLQYEVITEGKGRKPKLQDEVKVHYHGTLIDGTVFDSSVERDSPATFFLQDVIKGWTEILQLMPVGSKWRVYIPYEMGYQDQGAGPMIKPYSALIFEIELLDIL